MHRNATAVDVFNVRDCGRFYLKALVATTLLASAAQADEPSHAAQVVSARGIEWITSAAPVTGVRFASGATAISLDRATKTEINSLAGRLAGARLLATAVFDGKPLTMASTLSQQLRLLEDVPAEKLQPLLVDDTRAVRADTTACDWATELLAARDSDIITAAVFWFADERNHSLLNGLTPEPRLIMVLFRSTRNAAGDVEIVQIAWGPIAAPK